MKLMILDGNSIINRAFYGIRMLNAPDGTPTNAVYGFLSTFRRVFDLAQPQAVCVAFDVHAPTFRHEQYALYKAQRKPMPEELAVQIPLLKEVLDAMGIRRYELEGYEADDILGTASLICEKSGWKCTVVTGDKDSLQLISDDTTVCNVKTRMGRTETIMYTPARFEEEYGFAPPLMVDLKALMGDASDNIPGVPGVGEKTAMELVQRFGAIDDIYAHLPELDIKDGVRKKLAAGEESARRSYWLATILRKVPMAFDPQENAWNKDYAPALFGLFKRLGFNKFIEKWGVAECPGEAPAQPAAPALEYVELAGSEQAEALCAALKDAPYVAVLPLDGLDRIELCDGARVYSAAWSHCGDGYNALLRAVFSPDVKKLGCGVKDTMRLVLDEGLSAEGFIFDAALAAYLLDATDGDYSLPRISMRWLGAEMHGAQAVWALYPVLEAKLRELSMDKLYYTAELPLCRVLADMERAGFYVDRQALYDFGESLNSGIAALQESIWGYAGGEFNINSPKQLGEVLFDKLMLPFAKKTKTGYSTNADVLEKLRGKHPIVDDVLEYRMLTKLKSTYAKQNKLLRRNKPERVATRTEPLSGTAAVYGSTPHVTPRFPHVPLKRKNSRAAPRLAARPSDCHRYAVSTDSAIVGMPSARTRITHTTTVKIFFILAERSRCACARASRSFAALMRSLFCCAVSFCCLLPDFLAMGYSLSFPRISMTRAMCLATSTSMCHLSRS